MKLLTTPEMRSAAVVLRDMGEIPYGAWSEEQKSAVSLRCNNFDVAGMFVQSKMASEELIADGWTSSIQETYRIAGPHIAALRERFKNDTHWRYFEQLAIGSGAIGHTQPEVASAEPTSSGGAGITAPRP
ncbi:DUF4760 domain-containing protein [Actinoplanes friuliensis]|uniref:DUF4760 domain-containing protein n=1 Tax=Actinoplanes friuliensis TaxID=196914 RepID=UPI00130E8B65|nr:DUF4760 domain-containing protein [Actinoplanes friuliensis]